MAKAGCAPPLMMAPRLPNRIKGHSGAFIFRILPRPACSSSSSFFCKTGENKYSICLSYKFPSRIFLLIWKHFFLIWKHYHCGKGCKIREFAWCCSMTFEQGRICICIIHLLRQRAPVFAISSEGHPPLPSPILSPFTTSMGY